MITKNEINLYHKRVIDRSNDYISIEPSPILKPYIAYYTIEFTKTMEDKYTIIPSASSTITISINHNKIDCCLRGVNIEPFVVGQVANKNDLMILIEFRVGHLFPFLQVDQIELINNVIPLRDINIEMSKNLECVVERANTIDELINLLDQVLLNYCVECQSIHNIDILLNDIILSNGLTNLSKLSSEYFYSEKQIRRLFQQYVGVNPKSFARLTRLNYALSLIKKKKFDLTHIAVMSGFFDQSHFNKEFKLYCGVTPNEYIKNMSVFYNDEIKFQL